LSIQDTLKNNILDLELRIAQKKKECAIKYKQLMVDEPSLGQDSLVKYNEGLEVVSDLEEQLRVKQRALKGM